MRLARKMAVATLMQLLAMAAIAAPFLTLLAALFLPLELQRGADGAMTGFAYPEMLVQVFNRHKSDDIQGAEDLFDQN